MIINKNVCGIEFGEDEIVWQLDDEVVSYAEIADVVASKKAVMDITVGMEDGDVCEIETDEINWEVEWTISVFRDEKKQYGISSYVHALPFEYVELFDELGEKADFEKVATATLTKLNKSGFKLDLADVWQEIEGSCSGFYRERFATLEEAFEQIPVAFDNIYNYLNGKGFYIIEMLKHYKKI